MPIDDQDLFAQAGIDPRGTQHDSMDLFAQAGIDPRGTQHDSMDLFAQTGANDETNPILRFAANVNIGGANMGRNLFNAPRNLVGLFSPELKEKIPEFMPNPRYEEFYGLTKPNTADKVVQGTAAYAPFGGAGEAFFAARTAAPLATQLAQQFGIGNLFGATQSENPASGALEGGAINLGLGAAGAGIGKGLSAGWEGIKNIASKYAAQGLSKSTAEALAGAKASSNQQAFDMAKTNFENYGETERKAWDKLSNLALKVDKDTVFTNDPYKQALQTELGKLKEQSERQSAYGRSNKESIGLLEDYLKDTHGSFSEAIEHNKALNKDYEYQAVPGKSLPFNAVNYAKSNINKTIAQNLEESGLSETLGKAWSEANKTTGEKNKIFMQTYSPSGREKISTFSQFVKSSNRDDPTKFVAEYLPTRRGDGTQKMEQFTKMLGDPEAARNVIKLNYFDKALSDSGINEKVFIRRFNELSPEQQSYLFNPEETKVIKAMTKIAENNPDVFARNTSEFKELLRHSIFGALGMAAGHSIMPGMGSFIGLPVGVTAGKGVTAGMNKLFESPALANRIVDYLTTQKKPKETTSGLAKALQAIITPQAIRGS